MSIKAEWAELAPSLPGLSRFDLGKLPINNAVLVSLLLYFEDLPNFAALDRANRGDLRATVSQIIELAKSQPGDPFYAVWEASLKAPSAAAAVLPVAQTRASSAPAITLDNSPSNPPKK